jgi:hypothetical protein
MEKITATAEFVSVVTGVQYAVSGMEDVVLVTPLAELHTESRGVLAEMLAMVAFFMPF